MNTSKFCILDTKNRLSFLFDSRLIVYIYFFICSRRWFESRASDDAIFSFWTSMPSGTTR